MTIAASVGRPASADDATLAVRVPEFSRPPPSASPPPIATDAPPPPPAPEPYDARAWPREVSPLRLSLGGAAVTTGRGLGPGLGLALDTGRGSIGFRMAALWFRHEPDGGARDPSPLSGALSQYTGEITLDFNHRGPWHPVLGIGFGLAYLARGESSGYLGVGTGRLGLEYALGLDDVDVRVGAGATGVLPGPTDREVQDVRAYAIVGTQLTIGF